ncbi:hypothetical protein [Nocardioides convexus]|uniref:hypothetical protein n=1 Tax=Nocardioides convexus TaxID=2712224 RepID=UPI0024185631|nr:hypothetical protein [Nocardioides convexus]
MVLAVLGGLVTTAAAVPVVWLAVRHRGWLTTTIERSVYTASAMPGIVIALALVTVSIRAVPDLYQTLALLVAGYLILFLPRAVVSVRGTFELGPAGPGGRRAQPGLQRPGGRPPGDPAARRAGTGGSRRAGRPRGLDRA